MLIEHILKITSPFFLNSTFKSCEIIMYAENELEVFFFLSPFHSNTNIFDY
jgi:hypothetical protein